MSDKTLQVEVVDQTHQVWAGAATFISAMAAEGSIGIYAGHEPLLSILKPGEVRIETATDNPLTAAAGVGSGAGVSATAAGAAATTAAAVITATTTGGFLSVDSNTVRIVVDSAKLVETS